MSRLLSAIAAVRIERNPATMCELYDALNQRRYSREVHLTDEEKHKLTDEYLRMNAPDLRG